MTNNCIGIVTNSKGLDDCCQNDVGEHDDGSCEMMMKDLFHGVTYHGVSTKRRDNDIRMDEERRGFTNNGLSLENKPRGNISMRGLNGTK